MIKKNMVMLSLTEQLKVQGLEALNKGDLLAASQWFNQALALKPQDGATLHLLGLTAYYGQQPQLALHYVNQAIQLPGALPNFFETLGLIRMALSQPESAILAYKKAIELEYASATVHKHLGNAYMLTQRVPLAQESYEKAVAIQPDYAEAWFNLAVSYDYQGNRKKAIALYEHAIQVNPNAATPYFNLGSLYHFEGRLQEAIETFEKGRVLQPNETTALNNLAYAYLDDGQYEKAREIYRQIIQFAPQFYDAAANLAIVELTLGDASAWRRFAIHKSTQTITWRTFHTPAWQGENLQGKRILLIAHSGFGDTFQYLRYVDKLKALGATVVFECEPEMTRLLTHHTGIDILVERHSAAARQIPYDTWTYLVCLPGWFDITWDTVPPPDRHLVVPKAAIAPWKKRLKDEKGFKIGIVWSGDPTHVKWDTRLCHLSEFAQLANVPGIKLYGLQKGHGADEANTPPEGIAFENLASDIQDFQDTAAIVSQMDAVITVDTALAHLAGTLGKPVYLMLPIVPDYRWMLDRHDTPWYPTVKLYRQIEHDEWSSVLDAIGKDLRSASPLLLLL